MDFKFSSEHRASRLDEIVSYLSGPRLWIPQTDYPDVYDWSKKAHEELKKNSKRALVCFNSTKIVGITTYQAHKSLPDHPELKNITVRPEYGGRYIASFLIRNSEIEGSREFKSKYISCDAKVKNFSIASFLSKHHYEVVDKQDLYKLSSGEDLIFRKKLATLSND